MRPIYLDFDPADENLTGFASNVTGATWTLTATESGDGLAHQVSIRNDTANDHSAKTAILVGTDADGRAQTETVNLPGVSATVESTKYFKTLTSVTPSATIGADTMDIGWVDEFASQTIPLDPYSNPITVAGAQSVVTGTISFDIEDTLFSPYHDRYLGSEPSVFKTDDQEDLNWQNATSWAAVTTSKIASLSLPRAAIRVVAGSYSSGAELQIVILMPDN